MVCLLVCCAGMGAQKRNEAYESYIRKYRETAVREMNRYRIPASITLAQGLLESGAGRSTLARTANNHFGIKCGGDWEGPSVRHTDDAPNECFRSYRHARESYEDHSKFLRTRTRYASLFRLNITDYKGWARGLKRAGYATDPRYADRLIGIIELYDLDKYDRRVDWKRMEEEESVANPHQPYLSNGLLYVIARRGDSLKALEEEFGIRASSLRKYNELPKDYVLQGGEIIYLEKKRTRATKEHIVYVVRAGDSMYSISQRFGIRLKNLYRLNKMRADAPAPKVGDILRLR